MFSSRAARRFLLSFVYITLACVLLSCAPSLQDEVRWPLLQKPNANNGSFIVRKGDAQCLARTPDKLESYFSGLASDQDVEQLWHCFSRALRLFELYIRGRDENQYSAGELRAFLEMFFLGDLRINDELLTQMMKIKQVFLGGSLTHLNRSELSLLTELFAHFNRITLRLLPHMSVFALHTSNVSKEQNLAHRVEAARSDLLASARELAGLLARSQIDYRVSDLHSLLREMAQLETGKGQWAGPQKLLDYVPLIHSFRVALTAAPDEIIRPTDWERTLLLGARVYSEWLRYQLTFDRTMWPSEQMFLRVAEFGFEALDILEEAVILQPDQLAEFTTFESLIERLDEQDMVPFGFSRSTAASILRPLVQRYLYDIEVPDYQVDASKGLSLAAVKQARRQFAIWVQNQLAIFQEFGGGKVNSIRGLKAEASPEMLKLRERMYPMILDRSQRMQFREPERQPKYDLFSLSQLNWRHIFVRMAIRGYAEDEDRARELNFVTFDEFRKFHNDIRFLARELEILDPRDPGIWKTIFAQADIFSLNADGDQKLSFAEAVELIAHAQSVSGTNAPIMNGILALARERNGKMHECSKITGFRSRQQCFQSNVVRPSTVRADMIGPPDVFGIPTVDVSVFRDYFKQNFVNSFSHMPRMVQFFQELSDKDKDEMFKTLERATRCAGNNDRAPMESADLDKTTMMFHFVESLFLRMDPLGKGYLTEVEINALYPFVRPLLERAAQKTMLSQVSTIESKGFKEAVLGALSPSLSKSLVATSASLTDEALRVALLYMLAKGSKPSTAELVSWLVWEKTFGISILATRMSVFKLLALLKSEEKSEIRVGDKVYQQHQFCGPVNNWPLPRYPIDLVD